MNDWLEQPLTLPAYLIDPEFSQEGDTLEFVDGKTEVINIPFGNAVAEYEDNLYCPRGYFTQISPFGVRKATSATLNGHKVVTKDMLNGIKDDILSNCVDKNAVQSTDESTRIEKLGEWEEDTSVALNSFMEVSKDQIVLSSNRSDSDEQKYQIIAHITPTAFVVKSVTDNMGEHVEKDLFKIDTAGNFYILKNDSLQKLQDLLK